MNTPTQPISMSNIEHTVGAEAGVYLSTGERWWGTRLRWRDRSTGNGRGKWESVVLVDVHPFDLDAVSAALERVVNGEVTP